MTRTPKVRHELLSAQGLRNMKKIRQKITSMNDRKPRTTATLTRGRVTSIGRENSLQVTGSGAVFTFEPWDKAVVRSARNMRHIKCRSMRLFNTLILLALSNHVPLVAVGGAKKKTRGQTSFSWLTRMASMAAASWAT